MKKILDILKQYTGNKPVKADIIHTLINGQPPTDHEKCWFRDNEFRYDNTNITFGEVTLPLTDIKLIRIASGNTNNLIITTLTRGLSYIVCKK